MDTRIRKIFQRIFLTCFIVHVSTNLQSQDFEKEYLTLKNLKMKKNTWLDKYQIYFNSSVIKKKDLSGDVEGLLEIGSYFYEIERKQISSITNTKSARSLYVIEEKQNKRIKFTDGSLVDVYLNGVLLDPNSDYNTTTANTIGSLASLAANDFLEVIVYDVFAIGDAVSQSAGGTFASSISVTGNVTATEGMTSRSEDVFNNRRIQINASANDTDEGSFLQLDRTASDGTDAGDNLITETQFGSTSVLLETTDTYYMIIKNQSGAFVEGDVVTTTSGATVIIKLIEGNKFYYEYINGQINEDDVITSRETVYTATVSSINEENHYLINEDFKIETQDEQAQNDLFERLDNTILDFSESNPFGDAGKEI